MTSAGSVYVNLIASTAMFEKGIHKATSLLGSLSSSLLSVQGIATGFLAFKGVQFLKGTLDTIDVQAKLADRLGTSTEALVGLTHAGDLAGVSADQLATAMEKMSRNVADAGQGGKSAMDMLAGIGLKFSDLAQLKPEEKLGVIADHLNKLTSAGEKSKFAVEMFGKSGAGMINVLQGGSAGLQAMAKDAEFLGLTFSRLDAAKVESANDAFTRLGSSLKGGLISAAIELSPILEAIANKLMESARNAGGFGNIAVTAIRNIYDATGILSDAFNVVAMVVNSVRYAVDWTLATISKLFEQVSIWASAIIRAPELIRDMFKIGLEFAMNRVEWFTESVKVEFNGLYVDLSKGLADYLYWYAKGMEVISQTLADKIMAASESISDGLAGSAEASKNKLKQVEVEAVRLTDRVGQAWRSFAADSQNNPLVNIFAISRDYWAKAGAAAGEGVVNSFSAVLEKKGTFEIQEWLAEVNRIAEENARKVSDAATVRNSGPSFGPNPLEENKGPSLTDQLAEEYDVKDRANKREREMAAAQQSWLTEMFGNQVEKRQAWDKQSLDQRLQYTSNILGNLSTLQNTHSKKMFMVGKIAAIANAIVTTAQGIARQFADLPIYAAVPAAAAVAVAGLAQISTISRTQFGGGGSVSSSGGSVPLVNGEPVGVGQTGAAGVTGNQQNVLNVTFTGLSDDMILNGRAVRNLITQINEAQADGSPLITVNAAAA